MPNDPQENLRRMLDEGLDQTEEIPAVLGGLTSVPSETAPLQGGEPGLLKGILDILTTISGVGLPVKGAVITKAIGSKL